MEREKIFERLTEIVESELEKLVKKSELNAAEIKAATDAVCLLEKIEKLQNEGNYDHSERRSARTGRYMSNGYSRHSIHDRIVDKLERMMDDAGSDYERNVLAGWIAKVESE